MRQRLQDIVDASWSYLTSHESLKVIPLEDIVQRFPGTLEGGNATVEKAKLKAEDGTEKLVALKVLKYSARGDTEKERLVKVSQSLLVFNRCIS